MKKIIRNLILYTLFISSIAGARSNCQVYNFSQIICVKNAIHSQIEKQVTDRFNVSTIRAIKSKIFNKTDKIYNKLLLSKNITAKYNELYKSLFKEYIDRTMLINGIKKEFADNVIDPGIIVTITSKGNNYKVKPISKEYWRKYFKESRSFKEHFGLRSDNDPPSFFKEVYKNKVKQRIINDYFIKNIFNKASVYIIDNALSASHDGLGNIYLSEKSLNECDQKCLETIMTHEITHLFQGVPTAIDFELNDKLNRYISNLFQQQQDIVSNLAEVSADIDTLYYLNADSLLSNKYINYLEDITINYPELSEVMIIRVELLKFLSVCNTGSTKQKKETLLGISLVNDMIESLRIRQFRYHKKNWENDLIMGVGIIKNHLNVNMPCLLEYSKFYKMYRDSLFSNSIRMPPINEENFSNE